MSIPPGEGRAGPYPACNLLGKGLHQCLHAVVHEHGGVVEELLVAVLLSLDDEGVGHQPVPVIELVELHGDAILVLELRPKQELGVELEAQVVPTEVLDIIFNNDLNGLPWAGEKKQLAAAAATSSVPEMLPTSPTAAIHHLLTIFDGPQPIFLLCGPKQTIP